MKVCDKRTVGEARPSMWRSRWAAIGAAVAVSVGAGGMFVAQAAPGTAESTIVSVTPERILDTRNGNDVGLPGPFVSAVAQKLQVTGSIPTATGNKTVVPAGATGVLLNVTPVSPTTAGFISIRPGDAAGAATTSSLNFTAGGISPNSVQVAMPTAGANAGKIDITFDAYGVAGPTTDVLIDVVGYTTNTGLQELVADVAAKANAVDVYTKAQVDAGFVPQGEIVMSDTPFFVPNQNVPPTAVQFFNNTVKVVGGNGAAHLALEGPRRLGTVDYGLKSISYCITARTAPAIVTSVGVRGMVPNGAATSTTDFTDRNAVGCYTVNVNNATASSYLVTFTFAGSAGELNFESLTTTWAPSSTLDSMPSSPIDPSDPAADN